MNLPIAADHMVSLDPFTRRVSAQITLFPGYSFIFVSFYRTASHCVSSLTLHYLSINPWERQTQVKGRENNITHVHFVSPSTQR
jgi:hypothetical protein